jgi:hypothetical protein
MPWHKVTISLEDAAQGRHLELQREFEILFKAAHSPKDMALLGTSFTPSGKLTLYFSPAASEHAKDLIAKYGGSACGLPPYKRATVLIGRPNALDRFVRAADS